jgi:myo-inositol-1(or 4)-monophosphatase
VNELDFIRRALGAATKLIQTKYADRNQFHYDEKEAADILTRADIDVQHLLAGLIDTAYPGEAILAEEEGRDEIPDGARARCWIIDPIDGTYNFARDLFPTFGISLACTELGQPIAGGIALPGLSQLYLAARGQGATCNEDAIQVSSASQLATALVGIDYSKPSKRDLVMRPNTVLAQHAGQIRAPGCAVVGLCAVATGHCEAHFDAGLQPWDIAAGALIVEEAGGRVSRADGSSLDLLDGGQGLLASNVHLHDELLRLLNEH